MDGRKMDDLNIPTHQIMVGRDFAYKNPPAREASRVQGVNVLLRSRYGADATCAVHWNKATNRLLFFPCLPK